MLLLKVLGIVGGIALFVYVLCLIVLDAKKRGRTGLGGELAGAFLTVLGPVISPAPPREEVATEMREVKRNDDSGDDPSSESPTADSENDG